MTADAITGIGATMPVEQALNIIGLAGCGIVVVMFGGPLATIKTVLKDKSTASLPFAFTLAAFVNCSLWFSYGAFVLNDAFIWAPNGLGLCSAVAQLGLFAKFGIQTPEK